MTCHFMFYLGHYVQSLLARESVRIYKPTSNDVVNTRLALELNEWTSNTGCVVCARLVRVLIADTPSRTYNYMQ